MVLTWPDKDPEEVLDYPVGFSQWLIEGLDLETTTPAPTVVQEGTSEPDNLTDVTVDNIFVAGKDLVVWLSGGTVGNSYTFKITANDTGNPIRTVVRRVKIKIKQK